MTVQDTTSDATTGDSQDMIRVQVETTSGDFTVALDSAHAPHTVNNFLQYVDGGFYDGGRFHRTVRTDNNSNAGLDIKETDSGIDPKAPRGQLPNDEIVIEVIQGGINPARSDEQRGPITLERTSETCLKHSDGTISMARLTPDSAVSDFFVCINDQPELDFGGGRNQDGQGFAAFGQVVEGMDVVRAIQTSPSEGQSLTPAIGIIRITRV
ncbi:MAG: peptidylprolyl isomerase [Thermomicrobiales bacterium]